MNKMKDIQNSFDNRNVSIDKVGVKNVRYPIVVDDRTNISQNTIAELDIYVDLPHNHRGTHMSRFLEVLNEFHLNHFISNLSEFLLRIKEKLESETAYVNIRFPYYIKKQAPVSKKESLLFYDCIFEASYKEKYELIIGVEVPITTLCPCSKEISKYGAHNQRSVVRIEVKYDEFVWLEELIDLVESAASCQIYPLLKRPDEKYVTEKAYENPMFVEDMVREITTKISKDKRITAFKIESENFESIHSHNAFACVTRSNQ